MADDNPTNGGTLTFRGVPLVFDNRLATNEVWVTTAVNTTGFTNIMTTQAAMNQYENLLVADERYQTITWNDVRRSDNSFWRSAQWGEPVRPGAEVVEVDEGL